MTPDLSPVCHACGTVLGDGQGGTCVSCGSPIVPPQRRVVTLMFVDLTGYTRLCSELDHEEVHLLVRPLMNGLRRAVEDLGGMVPSIEGDGFMAVFGGAVADPDDPMKAVVAAAKLQHVVDERRRSYPTGLSQLRVGLHVGEVLVAPSWERAGYSISGDVVNVARRLCDSAQPGEVLVSGDLKQLLHLEAWGPERSLALRNRDEEVVAAPLLWTGLQSSVRARQRPRTTPLVGRRLELAALLELPRGASSALVGPAGVGKSRLVAELAARRASPALLFRYHCASFDVAEDLAVCRAVVDSLPPEVLQEALEVQTQGVRELVGELLDPQPRDRHTKPDAGYVEAVLEILERVAAEHEVLAIVEDVQWAAGNVLAVVNALQGSARITCVVTFRDTAAGLGSHDEIAVRPLNDADARTLVSLLLPSPPQVVLDTLVDRAGGLPLFLEQGAWLLLEQGTVRLSSNGCELVDPQGLRQVPTLMRLFVGARLDNLPEQERLTLATASVLGDSIDPLLLEGLVTGSAPAVEALLAGGFLVWAREPGNEDRVQLRFAHALVRDVAYESLLRRERSRIHCAAADWYAVLPVQEMLKARVQHLSAALELGAPDCDLARQAAQAMTEWGETIMTERPQEALAVLQRLMSLAEEMPECEIDVLRGHLALAEVFELLGDEVRSADHARVGSTIAAAHENQHALAQAALVEARALVLSDPSRAGELLAEAEGHFLAAGDRAGAARAAIERAIMREGSDGLGQLIDAHREAYRVGVLVADARLAAHTSQQLAFLSYTESAEESQRWLERARHSVRHDDEVGKATLVLSQAIVQVESLDLRAAVASTDRARAAGRDAASDYVVRNALIYGAEATVQLGPSAEATAWLEELEAAAARRPNALLDHNARVTRALSCARAGEPDAADDALDVAHAHAAREGLNYERTYLAMRAQVLCERGEFHEAAALAARTALLDVELRQPFPALRAKLMAFRAQVGGRERISLSDGLALPREADERGAPVIRGLARLWIDLDETLRGERGTWDRDVPDLAEAHALDLEVSALRRRRPDDLLAAAAAWADMGCTIWRARALLWHEAATGNDHSEAHDLLVRLNAPAGIAERLKAQVDGLLG